MMLCGLLWMLFVSGLQTAAQSREEKEVLAEGETLVVNCPSNIKYAYSKKAWQRLKDGEQPQTLVVTERSEGTLSEVQEGRYILRDDPEESMLQVRMINLQVEDSGLYRCVVYYPPPKEPVLLFHPVRLVVTTDASTKHTSDNNPASTLAPTTNTPSTPYTSSRTVAPSPPIPTVVFFPKVTDANRLPVFGIVVPVACGIFIKSLIFTTLFAVTQRSFGP